VTQDRRAAQSDIPAQHWANAATRDAIRHFAWGIGDNNPLWTDEAYAAKSLWGERIAPPCLLYAAHETTVAPGMPDHRRIYRTVDWTFYDVIREGDALASSAFLLEERPLGKNTLQKGRVEFRTAAAQIIAIAEAECLRSTEPAVAINDRPELRYTGDELEATEQTILSEQRRGDTPRFWEKTHVGDTLAPLVKGPLSIMDVVAWCAATTGAPEDEVSRSEGGLHTQTATGPELVSWFGHLITDWMGDDAFLHKLVVQVDALPTLGTTTTITGHVDGIDLIEDRPSANLAMRAFDQGGSAVAAGSAQIILPSSAHGPVALPIPFRNKAASR
jgi:acyl dehydratase